MPHPSQRFGRRDLVRWFTCLERMNEHLPGIGPGRDALTTIGGPFDKPEQRVGFGMRARPLPFAIGAAERDQWLLCMNRALEELGVEPDLRRNLSEAFQKMADHMQNQYLSGSLGRLAQPDASPHRSSGS